MFAAGLSELPGWKDEDSAGLVQPPSISTVKISSHATGAAVNPWDGRPKAAAEKAYYRALT
jgi:hypothetical protein